MTNRVIQLVPSLFSPNDTVGGAERYVLELARYIGDRERTERVGNLEVRVLGRPHHVRGQQHNPLALRLFRELRDAQVIHCHQQHILASSLAALYCRLTGRHASRCRYQSF